MKKPIFKQDFIVNINNNNQEFLIYTRNPKGSSKWVKDINEFFIKYGKNGNYANSHHPKFEDLPAEIKNNALRTIKLGEKIKSMGYEKPPQDKINQIYKEVMVEKSKEWIIKKPL